MKSVLVAFLLACALSVSAFRWAEGTARDFLTTLGIDKATAEADVFNSVWSDYVAHPTGDRVRAVVFGDRPALAREVIQFARDYTASPEFLERYTAAREELRPEPPQPLQSGEEMVATMKADLQKQIAETQAQADQATGDMKEMLLGTIEMFKEQLAMLDDPDNPFLDPSMQVAFAAEAAAQTEEYDRKVAEWEQLYPADPEVRIAERLDKVLAQCSDVDFSAQVVENEYGVKIFADDAYETKSAEWKACYRAGPEAVEAGNAALADWRAALQ